MNTLKSLIICALVAGVQFAAVAAFADNDGGKGGGGRDGGGRDGASRGGGGGGPAPLLGLTVLGQLGGAAGIFAAWRKRNRKDGDGSE